MTGVSGTGPKEIVFRFNDSINLRDIDGLADLMSDDHTFIDSEGGVVSGKHACLQAWQGFFDSFPDYRNVFASVAATDDLVTIVGHSMCSEPSLAGPAIWTALIRNEKVTQWRVYTDSPENRARLRV